MMSGTLLQYNLLQLVSAGKQPPRVVGTHAVGWDQSEPQHRRTCVYISEYMYVVACAITPGPAGSNSTNPLLPAFTLACRWTAIGRSSCTRMPWNVDVLVRQSKVPQAKLMSLQEGVGPGCGRICD